MTKIALQLAIFVVAAVSGFGFALTSVLPEPAGRSLDDIAAGTHEAVPRPSRMARQGQAPAA